MTEAPGPEAILTVVGAFVVTIAVGFLVNKYTLLFGFRGTALCLGIVLAAGVLYLAYNEPLLEVLGPYAKASPRMFRLWASVVGLVVFFVAAVTFEKNYERLERRMATRVSRLGMVLTPLPSQSGGE